MNIRNPKGMYLLILTAGTLGFGVAAEADETVAPNQSAPPPMAIYAPDNDPSAFYLSSVQGCYGQNNRHTKNSARATSDSTIQQIYQFSLTDGSSVYRMVKRKGDSIQPQLGPAFVCNKVPPSKSTNDGVNCKSNSFSDCDFGSGPNISYRCKGPQHTSLSEAHNCSILKSGRIISCDPHVNGGPRHLYCKKKRAAKLVKSKSIVTPAEIECRHDASSPASVDYVSSTEVLKSDDGKTWTKDDKATVELSSAERFQVKILGLKSSEAVKPASVKMQYVQVVPSNASNCGFSGCNGPITYRERNIIAKDKAITVDVAFAGSDGFCGGYHSPLMLFFPGEHLPKFTGDSEFKMGQEGRRYSWPEEGAGGWFLALDSKGNRKISDESQLFGNNDPGSNGFDALAVHDDNKDGIIDSSDRVFSQLLLWNDRNSDSISQAREVKSLKEMGVESISLQFSTADQLDLGDRATAKERSIFKFRKKGRARLEEGIVYDIWFAETH